MPPAFRVELVPHSREWAGMARREAARLAAALGAALSDVHHIGSTAIPGIQAKPIIDLIPVFASPAALDTAEPVMRGLGYECWGEYGIPGRRYCTLSDPATGRRQIQAHGFCRGSPEIARHLAFRDFLCAHPAKALEYERVKLRSRDLHPENTHDYTDAKGAWIKAIEDEALAFFGTPHGTADAGSKAR
jgi:GrpB-like predicted nucleotidyltransferase (UPF0157 family)